MTKSQKIISIGLAAHPDAQYATILGLRDLFSVANRLQQEKSEHALTVDVQIVEEFDERDTKLDTLVLPPSLGTLATASQEGALAAWIAHHHKQGALVCSVCAGAFPLAASGLLDGRQATTHWALADAFAARFPKVRLQSNRLLIDDGDIITAGGLMAWTDLGLRLIARFMGPSIMLEVARFFLIDPGERAQSFYSSFSPNLNHGDEAILRSQHWAQERYAQAISVTDMAQIARLEMRTFGRRFQAASGFSPSEYLQQLRISKAKEQLELSHRSVDTIAHQVGYMDTSAFRKMFQKIVGLSPVEYRRRFSPGGADAA